MLDTPRLGNRETTLSFAFPPRALLVGFEAWIAREQSGHSIMPSAATPHGDGSDAQRGVILFRSFSLNSTSTRPSDVVLLNSTKAWKFPGDRGEYLVFTEISNCDRLFPFDFARRCGLWMTSKQRFCSVPLICIILNLRGTTG